MRLYLTGGVGAKYVGIWWTSLLLYGMGVMVAIALIVLDFMVYA